MVSRIHFRLWIVSMVFIHTFEYHKHCTLKVFSLNPILSWLSLLKLNSLSRIEQAYLVQFCLYQILSVSLWLLIYRAYLWWMKNFSAHWHLLESTIFFIQLVSVILSLTNYFFQYSRLLVRVFWEGIFFYQIKTIFILLPRKLFATCQL